MCKCKINNEFINKNGDELLLTLRLEPLGPLKTDYYVVRAKLCGKEFSACQYADALDNADIILTARDVINGLFEIIEKDIKPKPSKCKFCGEKVNAKI